MHLRLEKKSRATGWPWGERRTADRPGNLPFRCWRTIFTPNA